MGCDVFCVAGLADPMLVRVNESVAAQIDRRTAKFAVFMLPAAGNRSVDLRFKISAEYRISALSAMPRARFLHPNPSFDLLALNCLRLLGFEQLCGHLTPLEEHPFPAP